MTGADADDLSRETADLTLLAEPGTFDNSWSDEPPIVLRFQPREEAERWLRP